MPPPSIGRVRELLMGTTSTAIVRRTPEAAAGQVGAALARVAERDADAAGDAASPLGVVVGTARSVAQAAFGLPGVVAVDANIALLGLVGSGLVAMTEAEQTLTTAALSLCPVSAPAIPALTTSAISFGLPHAHMHPPNLIAPNPVPVPLPSLGPLIAIPYLSGANAVLINGRPAARCGDMGLALWCGGYFPIFEVMLGSSSVWIEGMRAARVWTDVSRHCMCSSRGPTDPPLGPMLGAFPGSALPMPERLVLIGGGPMPSLTSLAIAGALRLVFAIGGRAYLHCTASARVERILASGRLRIVGDAAYVARVEGDLRRIASTHAGREVLERIERSSHRVSIEAMPASEYFEATDRLLLGEHNAFSRPHVPEDGRMSVLGEPGPGTEVTIGHSPERWVNHGGGKPAELNIGRPGGGWDTTLLPPPPRTASDEVLLHELEHAANQVSGVERAALRGGPPDRYMPGGKEWGARWMDAEEFDAVWAENGYRYERNGPGAAQRIDYTGGLP